MRRGLSIISGLDEHEALGVEFAHVEERELCGEGFLVHVGCDDLAVGGEDAVANDAALEGHFEFDAAGGEGTELEAWGVDGLGGGA